MITSNHPVVKIWPEKILNPVLKALESCFLCGNLCLGLAKEDAPLALVIVAEDKGGY